MPSEVVIGLLPEVFALRSGYTLLAREVSQLLREVYGKSMTPKSVSRALCWLGEDFGMLNRRETTDDEKGLYNCRYIYVWGGEENSG